MAGGIFLLQILGDMIEIREYEAAFQAQIPGLIVGIQNGEFGVPITLADQPDLLDIPNFYQSGRGNFWVAVDGRGEVVGTIALIDARSEFGVIRKMFVRKDSRGPELSVAARLCDQLENWATKNGFARLLLGTKHEFQAAIRFYAKRGFVEIEKSDLPSAFPLMPLDTLLF